MSGLVVPTMLTFLKSVDEGRAENAERPDAWFELVVEKFAASGFHYPTQMADCDDKALFNTEAHGSFPPFCFCTDILHILLLRIILGEFFGNKNQFNVHEKS